MLFSPAVTGQGAENPGKEKCDNKQSLHIYSLELRDLCQVSATCNEGAVSIQLEVEGKGCPIAKAQTHPFVVIFNLCCHANLHH